MQQAPPSTLARPVRRQRAAPGVAGAGPSADGLSATSAAANGSAVGAASMAPPTPVADVDNSDVLLGLASASTARPLDPMVPPSTYQQNGGAAAATTASTSIALLGAEGQLYASLVSAVVPIKITGSSSSSAPASSLPPSAAPLPAMMGLGLGGGGLGQYNNINVYFNVPTPQTPVDEVVMARLAQNAPKYLAAFVGSGGSGGGGGDGCGANSGGGGNGSSSSGTATQHINSINNYNSSHLHQSAANSNGGQQTSNGAGGGGGAGHHRSGDGSMMAGGGGGALGNASHSNSRGAMSPTSDRYGAASHGFPSTSSGLGGGAGSSLAGGAAGGGSPNASSSGGNGAGAGGGGNGTSLADTELVKVYHSTPSSALASGFLESPTFGGGPLSSADGPSSSGGLLGSFAGSFGASASSSSPSPSSSAAATQGTLNRALAAVNTIGFMSSLTPLEPSAMTQDEIDAANLLWVKAQQGRVKTTQGVLVMNLRIGCDPPDGDRLTDHCATLECWLEPKTMQSKYANRGAEKITDVLEAQYKSLHRDVAYKRVVEGSVEDAKAAMVSARKKARRDGRVLLHYNGHGTPKATQYGEVWFTGKDHFYPMPIYDICMAMESPAIYVFDCNSAGSLLNTWRVSGLMSNSNDVFLCACSEGETLPVNALLPADLLTSCLTTPLTIALEWYINYSNRHLLLPDVTAEMIRHLPGDASNRRTPLGELNVILGSILDSIAWCTMPRESYYPILRNDQLVRNLYRNFFLADRLMREVGCTPVSHPPIPEAAHSHHLWGTWDVMLESVLAQLPELLNNDLSVNANYHYTPTRYFTDQLNAFEVWVAVDEKSKAPEQLPTLMLCLSQTTHRMRALLLLCRYLSTGPAAVHAVLYCGFGNLITRFLGHSELRLVLIVVWLQLMRVDPQWATAELSRIHSPTAEHFFIRFMMSKGTAFKRLTGHETAAAEAAAAAAAANASRQQKMAAEGALQLQVAGTAAAVTTDATSSTPPPQQQQQQQGSGAAVAPPQYVPMGGGGGLAPSGSAVGLDALADNTNGSNVSPTTSAQPNPSSAKDNSSGAAAAAQQELPSYCALDGITIERCRAISAYILCRMIEVQQQQHMGGGGGGSSSSSPSSSSPSGGNGHAHAAANSASPLAFSVSASSPNPLPTVHSAIQVWNTMGLSAGIQLLSNSSATAEGVEVKSWALLFISKMVDSLRCAKELLLRELTRRRDLFYPLLDHPSPTVRASCVTLFGSLVGTRIDLIREPQDQDRRVELDKTILQYLSQHIADPSHDVRIELAIAAAQAVAWYYPMLHAARSQGLLPASFAGMVERSSTPSNNSNSLYPSSSGNGESDGGAVRSGRSLFGGSNNNLDAMHHAGNHHSNSNNHHLAAPPPSSSPAASPNASSHRLITETLEDLRHRSLIIAERDIGVSSALNKSSTEGLFGNTALITRDDPPITAQWAVRALSRYQLSTIEAIVHDALVVMARTAFDCDNGVARRAKGVFARLCSGGICAGGPSVVMLPRPTSDRIRSEAALTMKGISSQATTTLTESDRVRERRNADLMRQAVLDLRPNRVILPAYSSGGGSSSGGQLLNSAASPNASLQTPSNADAPGSFPSGAGSSTNRNPQQQQQYTPAHSPTGGGAASSSIADASIGLDLTSDGPRPHHTIQHVLPIPNHDAIVSHQFRTVEPHIVTVERSNRISIVSYEDPNFVQLLESFQHCRRDPITSGLFVNDLADNPAYMVVDKAGVFTLYNNLLTGRPQVVSAFNSATGVKAGRHPPPSTYLANEVVCAYRPLDSIMFYGSGNNGINLLSVADEQLVLSIETPGEGAVSSIFTQGHGGRIVIAGFTDGVVRQYDDRTRRGTTSLVTSWETKPASQRTAHDAVVGVGFAGDTSVYVSTRNSLILFDIRQNQRPMKTVDTIPSITAASTSTTSGTRSNLLSLGSHSNHNNTASSSAPLANKQFITSFSMCSHFGLMATMTTEGVCDIYDARLNSLLVCGLPVNVNHTYYNSVLQSAAANPPSTPHPSAQYAAGLACYGASHYDPEGGGGGATSNTTTPVTPQQKAQDAAIAYSSSTVALNAPSYKPLRLRWDNTVNNVSFHPMRPMAVFGNELVTLLQTHSSK